MRKFVSILLAVMSMFGVLFSFAGCDGKTDETKETRGKIFNLFESFDNGWIDENDLKSIACLYYEAYDMHDNPYSGLGINLQDLDVKMEEDIKLSYREKYPFAEPEKVTVSNYYGEFYENTVIEISHVDINEYESREITVGGVIFKNFRRPIYIYHYAEQKTSTIECGILYNVEKAFNIGWLNKSDLESISCYVYERFGDEENPYSGAYNQPFGKLSVQLRNEIKQTYLEQIEKSPDQPLDNVMIVKYFGIYNGYIVVMVQGSSCRFPVGDSKKEIGGVTFCNYSWNETYVYYRID